MRCLTIYRNKTTRYDMEKVSLAQEIFTIVIILYPIINIYQSGINIRIGIGDALLLAILVIYAPDALKRKLIITDYLVFSVYIIIISFIDIASINGGFVPVVNLIRILRHGFFGVIVCMYMPHYFNLQYGISLMKKLSCFVTVGIFLQTILFYVFHKIIYFWLPVKTFTGGGRISATMSSIESFMHAAYFRPPSVFQEPAHFSQYVIVGVLLFLFLEKNRKRAIIGAVFCSLGILLSTSAGGIAVLVLSWMIWLWGIWKRTIISGRIKRFTCFILLLLVVIVVGILLFSEIGKMMMFRIHAIGLNKAAGSGNVRTLKGFLVFLELNIWRKIGGLGLGNIDDYFTQMHMTIPFGNGEYMNSFTYILNSTGICGGVLLFIILIRRVFHENAFRKALSLVVLALSLGASIFNSGNWLIYMGFLLYNRSAQGILFNNKSRRT